MPLIKSAYRAPWFLRNGHAHTIWMSLATGPREIVWHRERLELTDGDFLDLDWHGVNQSRLVVICHGLEGSSDRAYVRGMARKFHRAGWATLAVNFRGCGGEPNRLVRFYHSGVSEDLWEVLAHAYGKGFKQIGIVGFSLGGNVTLKLMGELAEQTPQWLIGAVGISVPCDLTGASLQMARWDNSIYMRRFLRDLRGKIQRKMPLFPDTLNDQGYERLRTFQDFDDRYTAPLHGFKNAEDYWQRSGCIRVLSKVRKPCLMLNALDDPFLAPGCFPKELAEGHQFFHLECPVEGGHVGFVGSGGNRNSERYSEQRAFEFLDRQTTNSTASG